MCSVGAAKTAVSGRGATVINDTQEYRVVLPTLLSGTVALNSVFLHCDVSGRPYKIDDFREELQRLSVLSDVLAIGAYQMNHVWLVTLRSSAAKQRLVKASKLEVKKKQCLVIDPDRQDVRLKLHWVPFHVTDEAVRKAFEPFGKASEVTREVWRTEGFRGVQTNTRTVTLALKEGVTIETLPHQLRVLGANTLVVVPGRPPLCLRCKKTGHIRKDCRVPCCNACRGFGHVEEDCPRTYVAALRTAASEATSEMEMDEAEAEAAAGNEVVTPTESQATTGQRPEFPNQAVDVTPDPRPGPSAFVAAVHKSTGDAEAPGKDDTAGRQPTTASDPTQQSDTEANQVLERLDPPHDQIQIRSTQQKQEPVDEVNTVEMSEAGSQPVKRLLSETPSLDHAEEERKLQLRWKEVMYKKGRFQPKARTLHDDPREEPRH